MTIELITRYVKILIAFVLVWGGVWFFNNFGCSRVEKEMSPTIPPDKNATIDPNTRFPEQLRHDDFVAYQYEIPGVRGGMTRVTSRVVGLPGDRVKMVKGEVFVNGERAATSVVPEKKAADDYAEIIVPRGTVFVLCDNRGASKSLDSRTLGPIGAWAIVGKLR